MFERSEFKIFRKANSIEQRIQGKAGSPFFWLLFFGETKKSNNPCKEKVGRPRRNPIYRKKAI
ncbi:hypothetical protein I926_08055 [Pasteurella multocida subsp. multocida OH4807]|nr:hypothetical protein I926_08055 [Pasteurella multocida subsp. multocida OH4807]